VWSILECLGVEKDSGCSKSFAFAQLLGANLKINTATSATVSTFHRNFNLRFFSYNKSFRSAFLPHYNLASAARQQPSMAGFTNALRGDGLARA
jgi:hypothetical protein